VHGVWIIPSDGGIDLPLFVDNAGRVTIARIDCLLTLWLALCRWHGSFGLFATAEG
jgi:hypothetical protein